MIFLITTYPHEILIPKRYSVFVHIPYVYMCLIHKKSKIFSFLKNKFLHHNHHHPGPTLRMHGLKDANPIFLCAADTLSDLLH